MSEQVQAGAWVISRVWSKSGVPIDVKASGPNTATAIDDLYEGIKHGIDKFGWSIEAPMPPTAPAPTLDAAVKIALEEGNKEMAAELQESVLEVPPAPAGKQYQISDIAFVKILPQPLDRINIEFYGDDRKTPHNDFPSIKATKYDVGRAMGLLKHVTSADVTKPAEFMCRCKVYWTEGKEYKKTDGGTGHYRDIHHVRPA